MAKTRDISEALTRLSNGKAKPADLEILRSALANGIISVQQGIAVSGNATNSVLVTGSDNEITLRVELSAEALQSLVYKAPSPTERGDLPIGSHIPFYRNGFFTGRVEDLKKLAETLCSPLLSGEGSGVRSVVVNQAITGMGGIGKTQLAVEFAYEYGYLFQGVHWLDLREPSALDSQIALCGEKMGLPIWPPTLPEQVTATLREWAQTHPRLLILDNFEEVGAANEVLARLRHSGLRLLITSRHRDWPSALGLKRLHLEEFTPQESRAFLRNYLAPSPRGRGMPEGQGEVGRCLFVEVVL